MPNNFIYEDNLTEYKEINQLQVTNDNRLRLQDEYLTGYRIAPLVDISEYSSIEDSLVTWQADIPDNTDIAVQIAFTNELEEPTKYESVTWSSIQSEYGDITWDKIGRLGGFMSWDMLYNYGDTWKSLDTNYEYETWEDLLDLATSLLTWHKMSGYEVSTWQDIKDNYNYITWSDFIELTEEE